MARRRKHVLLASALCLVSVVGFVLIFFYWRWQMVDPPVLPMLAIIAPLMLVAAFLAGRGVTNPKTRTGLYLGFLWAGTIVLSIVVFGYLNAINALLDDSPPAVHRVKLVKIRHKKAWYRSVVVESWRGAGERETIWAPTDVLDPTPTHLLIKSHPGALGLEWIERVEAGR